MAGASSCRGKRRGTAASAPLRPYASRPESWSPAARFTSPPILLRASCGKPTRQASADARSGTRCSAEDRWSAWHNGYTQVVVNVCPCQDGLYPLPPQLSTSHQPQLTSVQRRGDHVPTSASATVVTTPEVAAVAAVPGTAEGKSSCAATAHLSRTTAPKKCTPLLQSVKRECCACCPLVSVSIIGSLSLCSHSKTEVGNGHSTALAKATRETVAAAAGLVQGVDLFTVSPTCNCTELSTSACDVLAYPGSQHSACAERQKGGGVDQTARSHTSATLGKKEASSVSSSTRSSAPPSLGCRPTAAKRPILCFDAASSEFHISQGSHTSSSGSAVGRRKQPASRSVVCSSLPPVDGSGEHLTAPPKYARAVHNHVEAASRSVALQTYLRESTEQTADAAAASGQATHSDCTLLKWNAEKRSETSPPHPEDTFQEVYWRRNPCSTPALIHRRRQYGGPKFLTRKSFPGAEGSPDLPQYDAPAGEAAGQPWLTQVSSGSRGTATPYSRDRAGVSRANYSDVNGRTPSAEAIECPHLLAAQSCFRASSPRHAAAERQNVPLCLERRFPSNVCTTSPRRLRSFEGLRHVRKDSLKGQMQPPSAVGRMAQDCSSLLHGCDEASPRSSAAGTCRSSRPYRARALQLTTEATPPAPPPAPPRTPPAGAFFKEYLERADQQIPAVRSKPAAEAADSAYGSRGVAAHSDVADLTRTQMVSNVPSQTSAFVLTRAPRLHVGEVSAGLDGNPQNGMTQNGESETRETGHSSALNPPKSHVRSGYFTGAVHVPGLKQPCAPTAEVAGIQRCSSAAQSQSSPSRSAATGLQDSFPQWSSRERLCSPSTLSEACQGCTENQRILRMNSDGMSQQPTQIKRPYTAPSCFGSHHPLLPVLNPPARYRSTARLLCDSQAYGHTGRNSCPAGPAEGNESASVLRVQLSPASCPVGGGQQQTSPTESVPRFPRPCRYSPTVEAVQEPGPCSAPPHSPTVSQRLMPTPAVGLADPAAAGWAHLVRQSHTETMLSPSCSGGHSDETTLYTLPLAQSTISHAAASTVHSRDAQKRAQSSALWGCKADSLRSAPSTTCPQLNTYPHTIANKELCQRISSLESQTPLGRKQSRSGSVHLVCPELCTDSATPMPSPLLASEGGGQLRLARQWSESAKSEKACGSAVVPSDESYAGSCERSSQAEVVTFAAPCEPLSYEKGATKRECQAALETKPSPSSNLRSSLLHLAVPGLAERFSNSKTHSTAYDQTQGCALRGDVSASTANNVRHNGPPQAHPQVHVTPLLSKHESLRSSVQTAAISPPSHSSARRSFSLTAGKSADSRIEGSRLRALSHSSRQASTGENGFGASQLQATGGEAGTISTVSSGLISKASECVDSSSRYPQTTTIRQTVEENPAAATQTKHYTSVSHLRDPSPVRSVLRNVSPRRTSAHRNARTSLPQRAPSAQSFFNTSGILQNTERERFPAAPKGPPEIATNGCKAAYSQMHNVARGDSSGTSSRDAERQASSVLYPAKQPELSFRPTGHVMPQTSPQERSKLYKSISPLVPFTHPLNSHVVAGDLCSPSESGMRAARATSIQGGSSVFESSNASRTPTRRTHAAMHDHNRLSVSRRTRAHSSPAGLGIFESLDDSRTPQFEPTARQQTGITAYGRCSRSGSKSGFTRASPAQAGSDAFESLRTPCRREFEPALRVHRRATVDGHRSRSVSGSGITGAPASRMSRPGLTGAPAARSVSDMFELVDGSSISSLKPDANAHDQSNLSATGSGITRTTSAQADSDLFESLDNSCTPELESTAKLANHGTVDGQCNASGPKTGLTLSAPAQAGSDMIESFRTSCSPEFEPPHRLNRRATVGGHCNRSVSRPGITGAPAARSVSDVFESLDGSGTSRSKPRIALSDCCRPSMSRSRSTAAPSAHSASGIFQSFQDPRTSALEPEANAHDQGNLSLPGSGLTSATSAQSDSDVFESVDDSRTPEFEPTARLKTYSTVDVQCNTSGSRSELTPSAPAHAGPGVFESLSTPGSPEFEPALRLNRRTTVDSHCSRSVSQPGNAAVAAAQAGSDMFESSNDSCATEFDPTARPKTSTTVDGHCSVSRSPSQPMGPTPDRAGSDLFEFSDVPRSPLSNRSPGSKPHVTVGGICSPSVSRSPPPRTMAEHPGSATFHSDSSNSFAGFSPKAHVTRGGARSANQTTRQRQHAPTPHVRPDPSPSFPSEIISTPQSKTDVATYSVPSAETISKRHCLNEATSHRTQSDCRQSPLPAVFRRLTGSSIIARKSHNTPELRSVLCMPLPHAGSPVRRENDSDVLESFSPSTHISVAPTFTVVDESQNATLSEPQPTQPTSPQSCPNIFTFSPREASSTSQLQLRTATTKNNIRPIIPPPQCTHSSSSNDWTNFSGSFSSVPLTARSVTSQTTRNVESRSTVPKPQSTQKSPRKSNPFESFLSAKGRIHSRPRPTTQDIEAEVSTLPQSAPSVCSRPDESKHLRQSSHSQRIVKEGRWPRMSEMQRRHSPPLQTETTRETMVSLDSSAPPQGSGQSLQQNPGRIASMPQLKQGNSPHFPPGSPGHLSSAVVSTVQPRSDSTAQNRRTLTTSPMQLAKSTTVKSSAVHVAPRLTNAACTTSRNCKTVRENQASPTSEHPSTHSVSPRVASSSLDPLCRSAPWLGHSKSLTSAEQGSDLRRSLLQDSNDSFKSYSSLPASAQFKLPANSPIKSGENNSARASQEKSDSSFHCIPSSESDGDFLYSAKSVFSGLPSEVESHATSFPAAKDQDFLSGEGLHEATVKAFSLLTHASRSQEKDHSSRQATPLNVSPNSAHASRSALPECVASLASKCSMSASSEVSPSSAVKHSTQQRVHSSSGTFCTTRANTQYPSVLFRSKTAVTAYTGRTSVCRSPLSCPGSFRPGELPDDKFVSAALRRRQANTFDLSAVPSAEVSTARVPVQSGHISAPLRVNLYTPGSSLLDTPLSYTPIDAISPFNATGLPRQPSSSGLPLQQIPSVGSQSSNLSPTLTHLAAAAEPHTNKVRELPQLPGDPHRDCFNPQNAEIECGSSNFNEDEPCKSNWWSPAKGIEQFCIHDRKHWSTDAANDGAYCDTGSEDIQDRCRHSPRYLPSNDVDLRSPAFPFALSEYPGTTTGTSSRSPFASMAAAAADAAAATAASPLYRSPAAAATAAAAAAVAAAVTASPVASRGAHRMSVGTPRMQLPAEMLFSRECDEVWIDSDDRSMERLPSFPETVGPATPPGTTEHPCDDHLVYNPAANSSTHIRDAGVGAASASDVSQREVTAPGNAAFGGTNINIDLSGMYETTRLSPGSFPRGTPRGSQPAQFRSPSIAAVAAAQERARSAAAAACHAADRAAAAAASCPSKSPRSAAACQRAAAAAASASAAVNRCASASPRIAAASERRAAASAAIAATTEAAASAGSRDGYSSAVAVAAASAAVAETARRRPSLTTSSSSGITSIHRQLRSGPPHPPGEAPVDDSAESQRLGDQVCRASDETLSRPGTGRCVASRHFTRSTAAAAAAAGAAAARGALSAALHLPPSHTAPVTTLPDQVLKRQQNHAQMKKKGVAPPLRLLPLACSDGRNISSIPTQSSASPRSRWQDASANNGRKRRSSETHSKPKLDRDLRSSESTRLPVNPSEPLCCFTDAVYSPSQSDDVAGKHSPRVATGTRHNVRPRVNDAKIRLFTQKKHETSFNTSSCHHQTQEMGEVPHKYSRKCLDDQHTQSGCDPVRTPARVSRAEANRESKAVDNGVARSSIRISSMQRKDITESMENHGSCFWHIRTSSWPQLTWELCQDLMEKKICDATNYRLDGVPYEQWSLQNVPTIGASLTPTRCQRMRKGRLRSGRSVFVKKVPASVWTRQWLCAQRFKGFFMTGGENFVGEAALSAFLTEVGPSCAAPLLAIVQERNSGRVGNRSPHEVSGRRVGTDGSPPHGASPFDQYALVYQVFGQGDLVDFFETVTPEVLSPPSKRMIQFAVARLLVTLHSAGIAHLDLTPENILVQASNESLPHHAKASPPQKPFGGRSAFGSRHRAQQAVRTSNTPAETLSASDFVKRLNFRVCDLSKAVWLYSTSPFALPEAVVHAHIAQEESGGAEAASHLPSLSCEPTVAKGPYMPPECWEIVRRLRMLGMTEPFTQIGEPLITTGRPPPPLFLRELQSKPASSGDLRTRRRYARQPSTTNESGRGVDAADLFFDVRKADIYMLGVVFFWIWAEGSVWSSSDPQQDAQYNDLVRSGLNFRNFPDCDGWPSEFLDLLKVVLQPDPRRRGTLEEVIRHPWWTCNLNSSPVPKRA